MIGGSNGAITVDEPLFDFGNMAISLLLEFDIMTTAISVVAAGFAIGPL